eukprot:scaffold7066_cov253-Pinguiococcus_pyrenoidosus.AAC.55
MVWEHCDSSGASRALSLPENVLQWALAGPADACPRRNINIPAPVISGILAAPFWTAGFRISRGMAGRRAPFPAVTRSRACATVAQGRLRIALTTTICEQN